jgi:glutamate-1-semialdehyde 2,1-aminomutase
MFYERGRGSRVWDVDGNEYIDYVIARGPLFFGHDPTSILDAFQDQWRKGIMYAGQSELEILVAEKICELVPCAEMVRFGSTGSEAVHAALRLARAVTDRPLVLRFEGHYHGWFDNIAWNYAPSLEEAGPRNSPHPVRCSLGQLDSDSVGLRILPWNDIELVEDLFENEGDRIAAIITEPVMCNYGCIEPVPGYLQQLREICDRYGSFLIFDEVITGFRLSLGGAQELYGVTPDLATYAKAMGGGAPVSAIAGKAEHMKLFGDLSTLHAGTYNANPPTMAACLAALTLLSEDGGRLLDATHNITRMLIQGLRECDLGSEMGMIVRGVPPVLHVSFADSALEPIVDYRTALQTDWDMTRQLFVDLQSRGIRVTPGGLWFLSTAHTEADVAQTLAAVTQSLRSIGNVAADA